LPSVVGVGVACGVEMGVCVGVSVGVGLGVGFFPLLSVFPIGKLNAIDEIRSRLIMHIAHITTSFLSSLYPAYCVIFVISV
jgi:hypothetical protein